MPRRRRIVRGALADPREESKGHGERPSGFSLGESEERLVEPELERALQKLARSLPVGTTTRIVQTLGSRARFVPRREPDEIEELQRPAVTRRCWSSPLSDCSFLPLIVRRASAS